MIRRPVLLACACGALWTAVTSGQDVNVSGQSGAEVTAETKSMRELRRDARRAQERFMELYNRLNQDRDQQIVCDESPATGTRLVRRSCMTRAQQEALARDAVDYLAASDLAASIDIGLNGSPGELGPVGQAVQAGAPNPETPRRYMTGQAPPTVDTSVDAYSTNMERLLSEHPELKQAYDEYLEARRRLEAAERR